MFNQQSQLCFSPARVRLKIICKRSAWQVNVKENERRMDVNNNVDHLAITWGFTTEAPWQLTQAWLSGIVIN
ncbi:MAG: hypothetical protein CML20_22255 [Rheinheimera sp.]|nr:hypothetical protein [Rheinheimera sp.]